MAVNSGAFVKPDFLPLRHTTVILGLLPSSFLLPTVLSYSVCFFYNSVCLKEKGEEDENENEDDEDKDKNVNQEFLVCAFDCLGQSWPKNATDSQGELHIKEKIV